MVATLVSFCPKSRFSRLEAKLGFSEQRTTKKPASGEGEDGQDGDQDHQAPVKETGPGHVVADHEDGAAKVQLLLLVIPVTCGHRTTLLVTCGHRTTLIPCGHQTGRRRLCRIRLGASVGGRSLQPDGRGDGSFLNGWNGIV